MAFTAGEGSTVWVPLTKHTNGIKGTLQSLFNLIKGFNAK